MYEPPHFVEDRVDVMHALIVSHPLGLLICNGDDGPIANPIPFMVIPAGATQGKLVAHVAKANQVWQTINASPETPVLAVFQGPQAYVTPNWYATKRETAKVVPTWNYCIVQARGAAKIIDDRDWLHNQVSALTNRHEQNQPKPWSVDDAPERFMEMQLKAIIGLEIEITSLTGKWKMSQNKPDSDRQAVAAGYDAIGDPDMAALVDSNRGPRV